jgi:hypothetical protein
VADKTCINAEQEKGIANGYYNPMPEGKLSLGKIPFLLSDHNGMTSEPLPKDMRRMEDNIRQAKKYAELISSLAELRSQYKCLLIDEK